LHFSILLKPF